VAPLPLFLPQTPETTLQLEPEVAVAVAVDFVVVVVFFVVVVAFVVVLAFVVVVPAAQVVRALVPSLTPQPVLVQVS
jgi:hypothetical protein